MAHVIWVTPDFAAHPRSGGAIRSHRIVSALAQEHDVDLVVVGVCGEPDLVQVTTGVRSLRTYPPTRGVRARMHAWCRGWPLAAARAWNRAAATEVRAAAMAGATVIIDFSYVAAYRVKGLPHVLHFHNVESDRPMARTSAWRGWEATRENRQLARWERGLLTDPSATVVTVSREDAERLGVSAVVVPNGCDLPATVPPQAPGGPLLFVGTLNYPPNAEGLRWWTEQVWPLLPHGSQPLRVVGRGGREALGALADHPALDVVGELAEVGLELAAARAVVVPLLSGGGSRLKIVEALAWGRPVVSTTIGAAGLQGLVDGVHYLCADEPRDFVAAIARLDAGNTDSMAKAGRAWAEQLSWNRVSRLFLEGLHPKVDQQR